MFNNIENAVVRDMVKNPSSDGLTFFCLDVVAEGLDMFLTRDQQSDMWANPEWKFFFHPDVLNQQLINRIAFKTEDGYEYNGFTVGGLIYSAKQGDVYTSYLLDPEDKCRLILKTTSKYEQQASK